jgi:hypothetical protein
VGFHPAISGFSSLRLYYPSFCFSVLNMASFQNIFPSKCNSFHVIPILATCPAHHNVRGFTTLKTIHISILFTTLLFTALILWIDKFWISCNPSTKGRAVAQAVSRCLPTAAARVRVRIACGFCGGQSGIGGRFFLEYFSFPCQLFHKFLQHHNHSGLVQ